MGILGTVKQSVIKQSEILLKKAWRMEFLTKDETVAFLKDSLAADTRESYVKLPEVRDVADNKILFAENEVHGSRNHVWIYGPDQKKSSLMRIGSIVTDNRVLETDYGYPNLYTDDFGGKHVFNDFFHTDKRQTHHVKVLIAPWSHYFRPEYFGFVFFIAAKLSRIKEAVPQRIFKESVVSYPLLHTTYEKELLDIIGFSPEQIIDSRNKKITFDQCILGNNDNWSYPNRTDVLALRKLVESKMKMSATSGGKRIYISRAGRRRILNEDALIKMLKKFKFEIIEDKPRTVLEQFNIYNSASFIMGPHGASFSNIIWSKPGTHLFELFAPTYVYNFFLYVAQIMGLKYSAYCNGPVIPNYSYKTVNDDIAVSVDEIEKYLKKILI